ncbi:carotenoid cleavage dioxygenase 1 [Rhypophila decipiens]|uniref:Carotenoid cleavage dioxygenase 1 n=1 Tax=Rhypophila decipiens TaxID=261697 RepID=A0AAN7B3M9_9PEZI|nr:carotenoid cleavage dioxygenase 1 [Rhypophila decipiens]
MMGSTYIPQGTTTKLSPADREASIKASTDNLRREAFTEWPNDAGFDGLTEHRGPIELSVKGNIPVWAAGSLYRTGPGQCKVDDTKSGTFHVSHWFDGLAHTHRFDIVPPAQSEDGPVKVLYSSRRQSEKLAADIKKKGILRSITFGQRVDPCVGIFSKFASVFSKRQDLVNVAVTVNTSMPSFGPGSVVLGTDASNMCHIDPVTMEPKTFLNQSNLHPELKGHFGAAHGLVDPQTGDYINYNLDFGKQSTYRIFRLDAATAKAHILAVIPYKPAFVHSFFMTQNYIVLCVPVAHYEWNGLKIPWEGNMLDAFKPFDPSEKCRWFVVDLRHGRGLVAEFESPARFFFHTVNAFEEEDSGDIYCEVIDFPNRYIIDGFYYNVLLNRNNAGREYWGKDGQLTKESYPRLCRFRLRKQDFVTGAASLPAPECVMELSGPQAGDFPVINPNYNCKRHRYDYILTSRGLSTFFDSITKVDTDTQEVLRWEGPHGHTPGEAIFVPRPPASAGEVLDEDDGVLLSVILDGPNRTSYLLCLDAKTMTELGTAECGFAVAIGLHGRHVSVSI